MLYVPALLYLWLSSAIPFVIVVVDSVLAFCVNVTCPFFIGLLLASCILMLIVLVSPVIAICFCGIMFTSCFCVIVAVFSVFVFSLFIVRVVLFLAPVNAPLCPVTSVMLWTPFFSVVLVSVMFICPSVIV